MDTFQSLVAKIKLRYILKPVEISVTIPSLKINGGIFIMARNEIYFYGRVSTVEQNTDRQVTAAKRYRPTLKDDNIFIDKITGKTFDRPEWNILMRILREGDELIISELDRLGRTKKGVEESLSLLKSKGVRLRSLDIPTTLQEIEGQDWVMELVNNILIEVYSSIAQQELERKEYRQKAGIEEAKKKGIYKGRKPIDYDMEKLQDIYPRWKAKQIKSKEFMELLGLKPNTFYRVIEKYEEQIK